jgi:glycosyltransferase involved in cell wall biosynthesis
LIGTADVVLLPYESHEQATSGVLAEAVAAGIPVVATGFPHAVELLEGGAGLIARHADPDSIAAALRTIVEADETARGMHEAALRESHLSTWPVVAEQYRRLAASIAAARAA